MLVTGARGFLGRLVCAELLARGRPVAALVRTPGSEPPGTVAVVGDLTDAATITAAVRDAAPDCVVHLAAEIGTQRDSRKINGQNLRMAIAGVRDAVGALLRRAPYYAPIVGPPGTLAAMASPDAEPGYRAMYPEGFAWGNEVAARVFLATAMYSPGRAAARVRCPLLVQVAARDAVTPPEPAERAARRAIRGKLVRYPIGHFDIYVGEAFERAVADQLAFLARDVLGR